ncbi:hypothetical protein Esti_006448 [Eimeria stiedai]
MWLRASQSGSLLAGRRSVGQHMKMSLFPNGQQKRLMSKAHAVAAAVASSKAEVMSLMNNLSSTTDKQREHVVVLGTGWAAVNFFRNLNPSKFEVTVVSPRNYFTFTPLLPSVCAGTLTPLSCIEPVRGFSWDRRGRRLLNFYEAHATDIDFKNKRVACSSPSSHFKLDYDKLVVAVGTDSNTFNLPGVKENAFFLKEVEHAVQIRKRVMSNFEAAALPTTSQADRERLLHFVVVGGGPTGVEAAAEFADVVRDDMKKFFPELMSSVTITLIEGGPRLLPTYAAEIGEYAQKMLEDTLGVRLLLRHQVTSVGPDTLTCKPTEASASKDTKVVRHGFVLWASGIGQVPLVLKLLKERLPEIEGKPFPPSVRALPVDERLRLRGVQDVFAMGDCAQITPKSLAAAADELWTRAGCCDASLAWLRKEARALRNDYPQLSPLKFDLSKEEDKGHMNREQFKQLLERIDAAYRSPAATAQNARQAGLYLAKAFNAGLGNELPAFCEEWKGSLAYVVAWIHRKRRVFLSSPVESSVRTDAVDLAHSSDLLLRLAKDVLCRQGHRQGAQLLQMRRSCEAQETIFHDAGERSTGGEKREKGRNRGGSEFDELGAWLGLYQQKDSCLQAAQKWGLWFHRWRLTRTLPPLNTFAAYACVDARMHGWMHACVGRMASNFLGLVAAKERLRPLLLCATGRCISISETLLSS